MSIKSIIILICFLKILNIIFFLCIWYESELDNIINFFKNIIYLPTKPISDFNFKQKNRFLLIWLSYFRKSYISFIVNINLFLDLLKLKIFFFIKIIFWLFFLKYIWFIYILSFCIGIINSMFFLKSRLHLLFNAFFLEIPYKHINTEIKSIYCVYFYITMSIPYINGLNFKEKIITFFKKSKFMDHNELGFLFIFIIYRFLLNSLFYLYIGLPFFFLRNYINFWKSYIWYLRDSKIKKKSFYKFLHEYSCNDSLESLFFTQQQQRKAKNKFKRYKIKLYLLRFFQRLLLISIIIYMYI